MVVCINKVDLNPQVGSAIERWCQARRIWIVGRIPYDCRFSEAQMQRKSVVEFTDGATARALREVWQETHTMLEAFR
jgi:MinD superfamily P-loop ATPase